MTNDSVEEDVDEVIYTGPHKWVYVEGSDPEAPRRRCSVCGAVQAYPTSDDPGPLTIGMLDPRRAWLYPAEPATCERKKVVIESVSGTCADLMEVTRLLGPAGYLVCNSAVETPVEKPEEKVEPEPNPPLPKKPTQAALLWAIERARNQLESVKNLILLWSQSEVPNASDHWRKRIICARKALSIYVFLDYDVAEAHRKERAACEPFGGYDELLLHLGYADEPLSFARGILLKEETTPRTQAYFGNTKLMGAAVKKAHAKLRQIGFRLEKSSL
jgi:hypothetical protein